MHIAPHIPKGPRYTIGARIENKFLDLLELGYAAYFSEKEKKPAKVAECIFVLDTLKFLVSTAWEGRLIANKQWEEAAQKLDEIGRMLGGWRNKLQNSEQKNHAATG